MTAPHSAAILSAMKVFFVALSIAVKLVGSALAQSKADWREIATPYDASLVERWEEHFDRAIAATARARPEGFYGISRQELADLKRAQKIDGFPGRWAGVRPCRLIYTQFFVTIRYDFFHCRLSQSADGWRIEKLNGTWRMDGQVFPDPQLGAVFLAGSWSNVEPPARYGDGSGADLSGVLRLADRRWLRIYMPDERYFLFLDIDLHVRLRR